MGRSRSRSRSDSGSRSRSRSRSISRSRSHSRSSSGSRSRSESPEEGYRVHIADLGIDCSKKEVENTFKRFGPLIEVWLARNPPCFAFLVYRHKEDAEEAISEMNGGTLCGCRVRVSMARPRTRGSRRRRGFDPNLRCYQCGERGHFSRDCQDYWRYMRRRPPPSRGRRFNYFNQDRRGDRRRRSYSRDRHRRSRSRSRSREHRSRSRDRRSRSKSRDKERKRSRKDSNHSDRRSRSRSRSQRSRSRSKSRSKRSNSRSESRSNARSRSKSGSRSRKDSVKSDKNEMDMPTEKQNSAITSRDENDHDVGGNSRNGENDLSPRFVPIGDDSGDN